VARREPTSRRIQVIDRAVAVMQVIARCEHPASLPEIAEQCGLNRATLWRLLWSLEYHGLVDHDDVTDRYSIGYETMRLGSAARAESLVRRARPVLERLVHETRATANLSIADVTGLAILDQIDPEGSASVNIVGWGIPLHCTAAGRMRLAYASAEERRRLLHPPLAIYTPATITDPVRLSTELDLTLKQGYSVSIDEYDVGFTAIGAPVLDSRDRAIAFVSIWGPNADFRAKDIPRIAELVVNAAAKLLDNGR
jgi:IclR family transcriptional regulator, KDG regulon repressor